MPQKKPDEGKSGADPCILRIGRYNNVVQWKEEMQTEATALYGMTGMFFTTNARYVHPFSREEEYNPALETPVGEDAEEDDEGRTCSWTSRASTSSATCDVLTFPDQQASIKCV